jgi:DNA-binding NtrC family response regulator
MTTIRQHAGLTLVVSEGSAAFFDRVSRFMAATHALVKRTDRLPGHPQEHSDGRPQVVALVSVTALAQERGWYGLQEVPVIWIGNDRHDRRTLDPLGGSRLLPLDFNETELYAMLDSVLPLNEPVQLPQLHGGQALRRAGAIPASVAHNEAPDDVRSVGSIVVARSQTMINLLDEVMAFAGSDQNVLIRGETGTGKELIAELVHQGHSRYSAGPLVAVNCGAIPDGLFESLFFGHTKGSFTGAVQAHKGYLEQANGGTLFMDEIGDLPLFQQVKLLRVLESGRITRVGSEAPVQLDFRLVSATNRNLRELVKAGSFRSDLYYRLAVIEFNVPNLDERGGADKIAIFTAILTRLLEADKSGTPVEIPRWVTAPIASMHFPGNVRQLRNLAERIGVIWQQTGRWDARLINSALEMVSDMAITPALTMRPSELEERARIVSTLDDNDWLRQVTADQLGMSRKTLWEKMRKYNVTESDDRGG